MGTTVTPPERSRQQRMQALERANEIRSIRAVLKRDLKLGRRATVDVVADPPGWVGTMKVFDLLLAMPRVGRVRATKLLRQADISPAKTIGGMTERQRRMLARVLWGAGLR